MKKDKILNFLIALLLALIVFNLFLQPKKTENVVATGVTFKALKTNYTVPNIPILEVNNNTDNEIYINTCKDLSIFKDSLKIDKDIPTSFCKDIKIEKKSKQILDLNPINKLFASSWQLTFNLKTLEKEYVASVTMEDKWYINNFFSSIFYAPVYNLFVLLITYLPGHSLWLAIIIVTLIIRFIILVPQHHILMNSKKMQGIQPKIKEIQVKYKWDQWKIWMELLELYKKEKVNPMWSCLPLLIQFPLLIVLYWVISWITSFSNYYYLYPPLQDFQVSEINSYFLGLNLIKQEWVSWIILAVVIWIAQFVQIKSSLTIHKKTKTKQWEIIKKDVVVDDPVSEFMPDPNVMNAFMLWWMPIMLSFTAYFMPSWVWIYWLIWTLFTLAQQIVVNKISKK